MIVTTRIAVRLPDDLGAWIDKQVATGGGSRAAVATKALRRYHRQLGADRDAQIYRETGGYPDLEGMHESRDLSELRRASEATRDLMDDDVMRQAWS